MAVGFCGTVALDTLGKLTAPFNQLAGSSTTNPNSKAQLLQNLALMEEASGTISGQAALVAKAELAAGLGQGPSTPGLGGSRGSQDRNSDY